MSDKKLKHPNTVSQPKLKNNSTLIASFIVIAVILLVIIFAIVQNQMKNSATEEVNIEETTQETNSKLENFMITPGDNTPPTQGNVSGESENEMN